MATNPQLVLGITGKGSNRVSETQSVLFDKSQWTVGQARQWLRANGYSDSGKVDITKGKLRFRQNAPGKYDSFATIQVGRNGSSNPFGFTLDPRHVLKYGTVMKGSRKAKATSKSRAIASAKQISYKGVTISKTEDGYSTSLEPESLFDSIGGAKGFVDTWKSYRNPTSNTFEHTPVNEYDLALIGAPDYYTQIGNKYYRVRYLGISGKYDSYNIHKWKWLEGPRKGTEQSSYSVLFFTRSGVGASGLDPRSKYRIEFYDSGARQWTPLKTVRGSAAKRELAREKKGYYGKYDLRIIDYQGNILENPANKKSAQDFQQSYTEHLELVTDPEFANATPRQKALMMTKVDFSEKNPSWYTKQNWYTKKMGGNKVGVFRGNELLLSATIDPQIEFGAWNRFTDFVFTRPIYKEDKKFRLKAMGMLERYKEENPFLTSAVEGLATGTGITLGASLMAPVVARSVKKALKGAKIISNPDAKYIIYPFARRDQLTNWSNKTAAFKHASYISHNTNTPIVVEKDGEILGMWKNGRALKFKHWSALKNPSIDDAAQLSSQFHGRPANEILEITESETSRTNLTMLGCLTELELVCGNKSVIPISFKTSADKEMVYLACDPSGKQLYIVGGNQSLPLEDIETVSESELEKDFVTVGMVHSCSYYTDKHHLSGPASQKVGTEYFHVFASPAEGKGDGEKPMLVYDKLNEKLQLVGGSYFVTDRGIEG